MAELESQPKTIQSLYSWYSENKLFVNRRYQRKLVWTLIEKQRLVESILKKFPIPAILLAERESGEYEVIDGLQRLHTIMSFIETSFPTLEGHLFDVSQFPTARTRADAGAFTPGAGNLISPRDVSSVLDYSIAISIMRGASEQEIDDVFRRINTYGHRLSDQERRQAGVQDDFSNVIRELACKIRGDASSDILRLADMPSISIDLPMTKHGYNVEADQVFWVEQGILRSTELRDSLDEQCLVDIAASVIGGAVIDRSKDALDRIYQLDDSENARIIEALDVYGAEKLSKELMYCIDELLKVCAAGTPKKLRNIIFRQRSTNSFPAVFAVLLIALHESLIGDRRRISSYVGVKESLDGLYSRVETSRRSTTPTERRKNINTIKGLISAHLVDSDVSEVYGSNTTMDIDVVIRRSEIELPNYELKQGLLSLRVPRAAEPTVVDKVLKTICGMANNGPSRAGTILIGVTNKDSDADRVKTIDSIEPLTVGKRYVVGVSREAKFLGESAEAYFARWKTAIRNSKLSPHLRDGVLSNIDYNDYFGLGVIIISIPSQNQLSYLDDDLYWREGDDTKKASEARTIAALAQRFV